MLGLSTVFLTLSSAGSSSRAPPMDSSPQERLVHASRPHRESINIPAPIPEKCPRRLININRSVLSSEGSIDGRENREIEGPISSGDGLGGCSGTHAQHKTGGGVVIAGRRPGVLVDDNSSTSGGSTLPPPYSSREEGCSAPCLRG